MADAHQASTARADLLVEIGCEELPPKALDELREALFSGVADELEKQLLAFDRAGSTAYSTPRRLALLLRDVAAGQQDLVQERRGPAVQAAFTADGEPTGAALGFARSVGMEVSELGRMTTDKGEWLYARVTQTGKSLDELIFPALEQAIRLLPVPRPMRWADHDFSFVRPVHWLVVLHGDRIIEGSLLGQTAGRLTRGHRIHAPGPHELTEAAAYPALLQQACVIVEPAARRQRIRALLEAADTNVLIDDSLLDEVNNLVEWPVVVPCTFEAEFLEVPHEALIASMQDHQKFFPVRDPQDPERVSNRFLAVSNIDSLDPAAVREGYERVIRPRLADARFFLDQDQKKVLGDYLPLLDRVVFQQKIGTVGDKCRRLSEISAMLAKFISVDVEAARRAAALAKCDLMTQMVGEFPELQGRMGRYYALASGEAPEVAAAIGEHYAPSFAGDAIPATDLGRIVSIADRADTLVGIFAAGLKPSGNKDPFALRRAALGLLRILLEGGIAAPLDAILERACAQLPAGLDAGPDLLDEVREFVVDRLRGYYREQGFGAELVNAVLASDWDSLPDLDRRLRALDGFMGQDAAQSLAAANKRIGNILRKSTSETSGKIDADILVLPEEQALFEAVQRLRKIVEPLLEQGDYDRSLRQLAELKEPVDAFFDAVMVMDEDPALRANRLALLALLKSLFDRIADLSVLG
jgi:glycyl-tRNA synthetase beta chain